MSVLAKLRYRGEIGFRLAKGLSILKRLFRGSYLPLRYVLRRRFFHAHGYPLDLEHPNTLNEKLQWLKVFGNRDFHARLADKYTVRDFIREKIGKQYLIPLVYESKDYRQLNESILPDYPVIIKTNHDAGHYHIIRDKKTEDWDKIRKDVRWWLSSNYYYADREPQYKYIERRIVIEKLLLTGDGKIPNDYKLNYINGELQFIYVSIDREGMNYRKIYDPEWNPLPFKWVSINKVNKYKDGPEIPPPDSLEEMKKIGSRVAKLYPYVRVDFYDVDGNLFMGEITQCHGGGFDRFFPVEKDRYFGEKLDVYFADKASVEDL